MFLLSQHIQRKWPGIVLSKCKGDREPRLIPVSLILEKLAMWSIRAVIFFCLFVLFYSYLNKGHKPGALTDGSGHGRPCVAFYLENDMYLLLTSIDQINLWEYTQL